MGKKEYIEKDKALALTMGYASPSMKAIHKRMESIEPADVKPIVRGEWVKVDDDLYWCSHCHSEIAMQDIYITNCRYCPVCGAEMEGKDE